MATSGTRNAAVSLKVIIEKNDNHETCEFNVDKCHIMHIGPKNKEFNYTMGEQELNSSAKVSLENQ